MKKRRLDFGGWVQRRGMNWKNSLVIFGATLAVATAFVIHERDAQREEQRRTRDAESAMQAKRAALESERLAAAKAKAEEDAAEKMRVAEREAKASADKRAEEKKAWIAKQPTLFLAGKVVHVFKNGGIVVEGTPTVFVPSFASNTAAAGGGGPSSNLGGMVKGSEGPPVFFVTGHPREKEIVVGDRLAMQGVRDGSEWLKTTDGGGSPYARFHWRADE